jgi:hypothetical protein
MQREGQPVSRLAIGFVVVGLALSAIGIAYIIYSGRPRELPPLSDPEPHRQRVEQVDALLRMLMHSFFLFMAFLFGSYLMVRIGRRVLDHKPGRARTEYVDAWGSYRLTQDEIETASARLDDDFPPDTPPPQQEGPAPPNEKP